MSESRPKKRKIEFIESYWTGGELGSDYQWNDNHGELIRCRNCKHYDSFSQECRDGIDGIMTPDFYCANGEKKDDSD